MKIYLAGGVTGNLIALWKEAWKQHEKMKLYLAGTQGNNSRGWIIEEGMKVYLAGIQGKAKDFVLKSYGPYILESFFYIRNQHDWLIKMQEYFGSFLLDSGAFTFMQGSVSDTIDWDTYTEEYAKFINRHDIKLFFELDIDAIVGLKEVERLRAKLEKLTNRKCIPVWHKSRGLEYWKTMVRDYDYVAIGGIVSKEIKQNEYDVFLPLLKIAKQNNCKVHGLGFTNLEKLKRYPFYSVDSTAWLYGNRGGFLYHFNGTTMEKFAAKGQRLKSGGRLAAINNFNEWLKFSQYADKYL